MSFKNSANLQQSKLRRAQMLYDLPSFPEDLPAEEKRACLVAHKKYLSEEIAKFPKNSEQRRCLGQLIFQTNESIHAIRPKLNSGRELMNFFVDVAKRRLTQAEFKIWMNEAIDLHQKSLAEWKRGKSGKEAKSELHQRESK